MLNHIGINTGYLTEMTSRKTDRGSDEVTDMALSFQK